MPAELPSGTVTLLFTDIEGSTRMLQDLGREAYVRALTEHRRLLREAFTSHGGVEVEMQGDSFHFAFPYARDAVAAAAAGQRALAEHAWESQPIKVRIGLHTGEPMQADGLYAGLDVHRAARVMSAAHGGQIAPLRPHRRPRQRRAARARTRRPRRAPPQRSDRRPAPVSGRQRGVPAARDALHEHQSPRRGLAADRPGGRAGLAARTATRRYACRDRDRHGRRGEDAPGHAGGGGTGGRVSRRGLLGAAGGAARPRARPRQHGAMRRRT